MDAPLKALSACCERLGAERTYWLAYSGGLDSAVLLDLAAKLPAYRFKVIHIHHGINASADAWALHCEAKAKAYGLPYVCERLSLFPLRAPSPPSPSLKSTGLGREPTRIHSPRLKAAWREGLKGDSLEAKARALRYQAFAKHVKAGDVLLTAHHEDDQAETVLLQLARGAGPKGLAAMPGCKPFHAGWLVRPLLEVARSTLLTYANEQGLEWVDDDSNACTDYARNFMRHTILPHLKARWPSIASTLSRSALHCAETESLLSDLLSEQLHTVEGSAPCTLSVSALNQRSAPLQKALIRLWINKAGYPAPNTKKLDTILKTVLTAAWDKSACVHFGEVSLRRHRDDLHLVGVKAVDPAFQCEWGLTSPFSLSGQGFLTAKVSVGGGFSLRISALTVRYRRGGEKISLAGRGTQQLKNLFQEWGVLPWERDRWPLLFDGETLVGVVGKAYHADYLAHDNEPSIQIVWEH